MNNKIRKLQWGDYFLWNNLSREDKVKRNKQIAKLYLDKGPSILNYYNALKAYFGGFNPKNPYLITGEPSILPGANPSSVANVVAREYLLSGGLNAIKSTDYLMKGIQGTFPKVNLSNILKKYNNEIINNGILSEFKNTGRFKNLMNEILLEIEKVHGKLGFDAFNIIKTNPEGLPYKLGQKWEQMYNFKKGGLIKYANARRWKHQEGGIINLSPIVDNSILWQQDTSDYISLKNQLKLLLKILKLKNDYLKYSTILGGISNYLPSLLSNIPIFKTNALTTTNNLFSDTSFWKTPTISNSIDNNFWTNPIIKNAYDNNKK